MVAAPAAAVRIRLAFSPFQPPGSLETRNASVAPAMRDAIAACWIFFAPSPLPLAREPELERLPPARLLASDLSSLSPPPVRALTAPPSPAAARAASRKFLP